MDRNLLRVVLVAAFALLSSAARGAAPRALFVTGTNDYLWCADVNPQPTPENAGAVLTTIRLRTPGDQLRWQPAVEIAQLPISLSNRGSELLLVLADGEWKIVWSTDIRSGNPLPNGAKVMALTGDGDDVWAIGGLDLTKPRPTTSAPSTATTSATRPEAPRDPRPLSLFLLRKGAWSLVADVPLEYKPEQIAAVSLAILDSKLTLAIVGPDRAVRLFTRSNDKWSGMIDIATLAEGAQMKLLDVQSRPAIWIADKNSPGTIRFANDGWKAPIKLAPSPGLAKFDAFSLAYALGQLRLLATDGHGRIAEQLYNLDGSLQGQPSQAHVSESEFEKKIASIIQFIIMGALLAWMIGSLRQRPNLAEIIAKVDSLHVAPLGMRLAGGLIDALPLIAGVIAAGFFTLRNQAAAAAGQADVASPEVASVCAGVGLYLLHVTLLEVLTGRSLGKMITGTRVANLSGSTPHISQLLARNALRLIDIVLFGVPLLAILQSPLRQRVADMMAGTTVVLNNPPPPVPLQSSDEAPPDQPAPPPPSA